MAVARTNIHESRTYITQRSPFNANGTFTGGAVNRGTGRLPQEYVASFREAAAADDFYAVYSYVTPIAWYANGVWTRPAAKYSVTTSRHQSAVNYAIA
jgi:hypothetical protein